MKANFTSSIASAPGGEIAFFGILGDQPFDAALIFDPSGSGVFIDNLYFGDVIPAPGAMAIFGLAALSRQRLLVNRRLESS